MIEMLGVLAIIGVLSVGGIAGYSKAMLKYKTNKTIDQITMLTTNIRTLYAQQDTFTGLGNVSAVNMGVVPDELIDDGEKGNDGLYTSVSLLNPFSGGVTIETSNSIDGPAGVNRAFIIGVNGIPKEACMAIATSDWGSNYSSGMIGMAVVGEGADAVPDDTTTTGVDESVASSQASTKLGGVYAGSACTTGSAGTLSNGAICAKFMPIQVAQASAACSCTGSTCSVAFKYY